MGQQIEFNPLDWDDDESELTSMYSEIVVDSDLYRQSSQAKVAQKAETKSEAEIVAFINGEKIQIERNNASPQQAISQEEEAFRRQIEDLFELLELEKTSTKTGRIRVYQTDSSPSRPWRFH